MNVSSKILGMAATLSGQAETKRSWYGRLLHHRHDELMIAIDAGRLTSRIRLRDDQMCKE